MIYIFQKHQSGVGKLLWIVVVTFLTLLGAYWSKNAYQNWINNPVLTTIASSATSLSEIDFPAVIICGQVSFFHCVHQGLINIHLTQKKVTQKLTLHLYFVFYLRLLHFTTICKCYKNFLRVINSLHRSHRLFLSGGGLRGLRHLWLSLWDGKLGFFHYFYMAWSTIQCQGSIQTLVRFSTKKQRFGVDKKEFWDVFF